MKLRRFVSGELHAKGLRFTAEQEDLRSVIFYDLSLCRHRVHSSKQPDLGTLKRTSATLGQLLKKGDIVVYESTVYPGVTEEDMRPASSKRFPA